MRKEIITFSCVILSLVLCVLSFTVNQKPKELIKEPSYCKTKESYDDNIMEQTSNVQYGVQLIEEGVSLSNVLSISSFKSEDEKSEWIEENLKNCFHSNGVTEEVNQ